MNQPTYGDGCATLTQSTGHRWEQSARVVYAPIPDCTLQGTVMHSDDSGVLVVWDNDCHGCFSQGTGQLREVTR